MTDRGRVHPIPDLCQLLNKVYLQDSIHPSRDHIPQENSQAVDPSSTAIALKNRDMFE